MKGGLASRFAGLISLVVLVATATVGFMVYRGAKASLIDAASDRVAHTAETIRVRIDASLAAIGRDVQFLASTPPVQGIVRARLRRGLDPRTAIRDDEWGEQLAEIFRAFMNSRSAYVQARLIGLAGDGRELVRVERDGGEVIFADPEGFRARGDEDYFRQAVRLPAGDVYLSEVRVGAEEDLPPGMPVLYVSTPVYAEDGRLFGAITVSVDLDEVLAPLEPLVDPNKTLYVASDRGDYLLAAGRGAAAGVVPVAGTSLQRAFPETEALIRGTVSEVTLLHATLGDDKEGIAYFGRLSYDARTPSSGLLVGVTEPHETILAGVRAVRNESALITLLLCLGALALAVSVSGYLTRPLRQITKAVDTFGDGRQTAALPVQRGDELGLLARAFEAMAQQIQDQMHELQAERERLQRLSESLEERVRARTVDLVRTNRELETSNRELREFADVAAHDLQEPLRKLRSFADLLRTEHSEDLPESGRLYIKRIYSVAERMSRLIADLTAYSHVTNRPNAFRPVDLTSLAHEAAVTLDAQIAETGADIRIHDLPTIEADPAQLRHLLEQLLTNAVAHRRPEVAPVVEVRAEEKHVLDASGTDTRVCRLEVRDNGVGFDEKYADRIFSPFERLHGRRGEGGTGMGLTICRRIAGNHDGTITAHSTPGEGATFIVTLPVKQRG